jgi:uncharacterized membrane protein (TIGR02234 family)
MRSAATGQAATAKYVAPAARREAARDDEPDASPAASTLSERMIWDALDEGRDPTDRAG